MDTAAKSELLVETGAGATVGINTQPIVSAAKLSVRGFVFEHHRLEGENLTPGQLLQPLLMFPLVAGVWHFPPCARTGRLLARAAL